MKTIAIPNDIFTARVRREYCDPNTALIREFVQNARDAKASTIAFTYSEGKLTAADDGHGIAPEFVEPALFVLGGSYKEEGSIGGMGAAKELCFYAHPNYEIHTRSSLVRGQGPTYEITTADTCYPGFRATIEFSPDWGISEWAIKYAIENVCRRSDLPLRITFNGTEYPAKFRGHDTKVSVGIGRVLAVAPQPGEVATHVFVRAKGLFMFQWRLALPTQRHLIVEVDQSSIQVFTQNRDGFRDEYQSVFSRLIDDITTQRSTFGRPPPRVYEISPRQSVPNVTVNETCNEPLAELTLQARIGEPASARREPSTPSSPAVVKADRNVDPLGYEPSKFDRRFMIDLADSKHRQVPKHLHPGHIAGETLWRLKAWKWAIELVHRANNMPPRYELGFTLNSEEGAKFSRTDLPNESGSISTFFINPEGKLFERPRREVMSHLIQLAAHEVAHATHPYHTERFIEHSENLAAEAHRVRPPLLTCLQQVLAVTV